MTKSNSSKEISLIQALIPIIGLIGLLALNVYLFKDDAISGSNQFILLTGGAMAALVGWRLKIPMEKMLDTVGSNLKSTSSALLILLMVGALSGTWLISGIIPTMIAYGMDLLKPSFFLPACLIICSIISVATGSSWTTSATIGIALIGIAKALDISLAMTAGAILSGAYFGDKMSPLSDTTNLAPAISGSSLFPHIKYMTYTTLPSFIISLVFFIILGLTQQTTSNASHPEIAAAIDNTFNVTGWLFLVPIVVVLLIIKKVSPLVALFIGTLLGGAFALIFQPQIVAIVGGSDTLNFETGYKGILNAITVNTQVETGNSELNDLFTAKGMNGMLGTIWLIICAMVFGGIMESIGALKKITNALLKVTQSVFGLFASTVGSCLALNITASDQYLAIVVPAKMYKDAYAEKSLAPENLSRTIEDSGTVTSVLIPWNTCGAYHSNVLGVGVGEFFAFAIFNWLSPFVTLFYAAFKIKLKRL